MATKALRAIAAAILAAGLFAQSAMGAQTAGTQVQLPSTAGDDAVGDQRLAVDSSGTAYAVYTVTRSAGGRAIILAHRPKAGSWSATEIASGNVGDPDVAVDDHGDLVVVWVRSVSGAAGHDEVWCRRTTPDLADVTIGAISNQTHNAMDPRVVIDGSQRATVAWIDDDPDPTAGSYDGDTVVLAQTASVVNPDDTGDDVCKPSGGSIPMVGTTSYVRPYTPVALTVDGSGNLAAAWTEWTGNSPVTSAVVVSYQVAGTGTWSTTPLVQGAVQPNMVAVLGIAAGDAGAGAAGDVTVGWLGVSGSGQSATLSTRPGTGPSAGTWTSATVNPTGVADHISVAGVPGGGTAALVSLRSSGTADRLDFLEHAAGTSSWSAAAAVSAPGVHAATSDLVVDQAGAVTAVWQTGASEEDIASRHRPTGSATWDAIVPVVDGGSSSDVQVAVDASGVGTLLWANFGGIGSVHSAILSEPPPSASMTKPATPYQKSTSFTVAWTATGGTGPVTYAVRYRKAAPGGSFGAYLSWKTATTAASATFAGSAGTTCFSVRGTASGVAGSWSAERCGVIPIDDRSLSASSGWTKKTATGYYAGTYRQATVSGKSLKYSSVKVKAIAIAVGKGPGYGKMKVYLGTTLLGTYSLSSSTIKKGVIVNVKTFTSVKTGALRIVVATSGKKVLIDAVYVRQ